MPLDVGRVLTKVAASNSPVWLYFLRLIKTGDLNKLRESFDLLRRYGTDASVRQALGGAEDATQIAATGGKLITSADDVARLAKIGGVLGANEATNLFMRVATEHGDKAAKLLMDVLGGLDEAQLATLKNANKVDLVATAVAKNDWRKAVLEKYITKVDELGGNSPLIRNFDEIMDVKGSGKLISSITDEGIQAEITVARKFKGDGYVKGDIPKY